MDSAQSQWAEAVIAQLEAQQHKGKAVAALVRAHMKMQQRVAEVDKAAARSAAQARAAKEEQRLLREELMSLRENGVQESGSKTAAKIAKQEREIARLNAELLELYKTRSSVTDREVDALRRATEMENKFLDALKKQEKLQHTCDAQEQEIATLKRDLQTQKITVQTLCDEHNAIQLEFNTADRKCAEAIKERDELLERIVEVKQQLADWQNSQNELFESERQERVRQEMMDATVEMPDVSEMPSVRFSGLNALPSQASHTIETQHGEVYACQWVPNSDMIATGGSDKSVRFFTSSGTPATKLTGHTGSVTSIDFDVAGEHCLTSSNDKSIIVWNIKSGRAVHKLTGHNDKVHMAKYLSKGFAVSCSQDRDIKVWSLMRGHCDRTLPAFSTCQALESLGGQRFLSVHFDRSIREWDASVKGRHPVRTLDTGHTQAIMAVAVDVHKTYALTCSKDNTLKLIDLSPFTVLKTFADDEMRICTRGCTPAFSPDGRHFAVGCNDGTIKIWNIHTAKIEKSLERGAHSMPATCVAWAAGGSNVASVGKDGKLILWS